MQTFAETLKAILQLAFETQQPFSIDLNKQRFPICEHIHMLDLAENTIFLERTDAFDDVYISISGIAYVVKYTLDGRRIIADTFTEPQIFGLVEAIHGEQHYQATVVTLARSVIFRINKERFLKEIFSNLELSAIMIRYLAGLSMHAMKTSENKAARTPYENLIIYLYNKSLGKKLPYRLRDNKSFIADSLQINKRSLYRYLNELSDEGIISRELQEIVISQEQFQKIERIFNTINEL